MEGLVDHNEGLTILPFGTLALDMSLLYSPLILLCLFVVICLDCKQIIAPLVWWVLCAHNNMVNSHAFVWKVLHIDIYDVFNTKSIVFRKLNVFDYRASVFDMCIEESFDCTLGVSILHRGTYWMLCHSLHSILHVCKYRMELETCDNIFGFSLYRMISFKIHFSYFTILDIFILVFFLHLRVR